MVRVAKQYGAVAVAHGCTGKGNDQVRIELASAAFGPDLNMLAPVLDWDMSRSDEIEYAKKHKAKGNGFGFGLTNVNGISRTMSARYYKDGSEIFNRNRHCARQRDSVGRLRAFAA